MSLRQSLERRLSRLSVENLPLYIVSANALVFVFELVNPGLYNWLTLDPARILEGEIWRLLTFLFVPPQMNAFFMFFWLYLIYLYGSTLEQEWGSFPFTTFYILGALGHVLASFLIAKGPVSNVYLNLSLFLAFAVLFPNMELLVFFVLPVKIKYLAILSWIWIGWSLINAPWPLQLSTALCLVNYIAFFGPQHVRWAHLKWQVYKNRRRFR